MNDKSTSGKLNLIKSLYGIIKFLWDQGSNIYHILGIRDPNLGLKFGISDEKIYLVTTLIIYMKKFLESDLLVFSTFDAEMR